MDRAPTDIHLPLLDDRREECGIVGINGIDNASELAFLALYALQHRGQEAAGICAANGQRTKLYKEPGLVSDVFNADRIASLPGSTALGHVRYSTAGGGHRANAQPIVVRYSEGDLAIVHNGNLTNANTVKSQLVDEGAIFQSSSDSEAIVHLIARSRHRSVVAQIRDALSFLEGAYALVLTVGDTMYAVRDPRGFRPLVLGKLGDGHVVTSETCALDIMGATFVRDIEPGGALRFRGRTGREPAGLHRETPAPCIFELVYFARPDSNLWGLSVDRARRAFGRQLAREHPVPGDCVIAVPDSANSAALGYSEQSGIPYELGLLRNHYVGRTFIRPSQADRDFGARIKYNPVPGCARRPAVVVVDDSIVRGPRAQPGQVHPRAGAAEVAPSACGPPVRYPATTGRHASKGELLGSQNETRRRDPRRAGRGAPWEPDAGWDGSPRRGAAPVYLRGRASRGSTVGRRSCIWRRGCTPLPTRRRHPPHRIRNDPRAA